MYGMILLIHLFYWAVYYFHVLIVYLMDFDIFSEVNIDTNHFSELYPNLQQSIDEQYYTIDKFNRNFSANNNDLSIFHVNIRSLNANGDILSGFLSTLNRKFQVICLTETFVKDTEASFLQFNDYNIIHSTRTGRRAGGAALLIKKSFDFEVIHEATVNLPFIESVFVKIKQTNCNPVIVASVCRPPNSNFSNFLNFMEQTLSSLVNLNCDKILMGDYNLDLLKINDDTQSASFYNSMNSYSLIPTILKPTRETNNSCTVIDNALVSNLQNFHSGIFKIDLSDHYPIFIIYSNCNYPEQNLPIKISYRNVNSLALNNISEAIRADINSELFNPDQTSVNFATKLLHERILLRYNIYCPIKTKFLSPKKHEKPWITPNVKFYIKQRESYFLLSKRDLITRVQYNYFRNFVTNLIKTSKKNYYQTAFDHVKSDTKKTWKTINDVLSTNKKMRKNH